MLIFAIGFNLWLYRLEPTATIDPNDNSFQFALVDRTNTMWDFATRQCSSSLVGILTFPICHFSYLSDHWVHNWAEGYNLPFYYSHVPQIVIVGSWRILKLFTPGLTLFHYYHIIIYLLLCFVPLPVFAALWIIGLPWLTVGFGALVATHLSTDGLYGLDPSSFLWRGYGLSSQLFAMLWLPPAIAFAYRFFTEPSAGDVKQFLRELAARTRMFWSEHFQAGRHLASGKANYDTERASGASRKNLFHGTSPTARYLFWAIVFTVLTIAGHLGIGVIGVLSLGFLAVARPIVSFLRQDPLKDTWAVGKDQFWRLTIVAGISIFLLSYWIVPTVIYGNYHNFSFWDPVWKFDSYGVKETMIRLLDGDLFDFGRGPYLTLLILLGCYAGMEGVTRASGAGRRDFSSTVTQGMDRKSDKTVLLDGHAEKATPTSAPDLSPLTFLFIFWLIFYFGRTTWGSLIDLIPGMKDFHLSRFLVGLHAAGMILAPIGFMWLADRATGVVAEGFKRIGFAISRSLAAIATYGLLIVILLPPIYKWTTTYNELNDRLIIQANNNHKAVGHDEQALFDKLRSLTPGRIYAGRGGSFGKAFRVAETPYFMDLSTYGLPTTLWLPETWSMNSDTEQYFSENLQRDYDLYNMRWVAAPPDQEPQPFWKLIDQAPTWKLYEVPTSGYFTVGVSPATVSITKFNFVNVVREWIQSDMPHNGLYPQLTFDKNYPKTSGPPNFKMIDEANYVTPASPNAGQGGPDGLPAGRQGNQHNIWSEPPVYLPSGISSKEQFEALVTKAASESAAAPISLYRDIRLVGPEKDDTDMTFSTTVHVGDRCDQCVVILKQTYHPDWKVWVDGKAVTPITTFPFYIGIPVGAGTHQIVASYRPSTMKVALLVLTLLTVVAAGVIWHQTRPTSRKTA